MERFAPVTRLSMKAGASIVATLMFLLAAAGSSPAALDEPARVADINPGSGSAAVNGIALAGRNVIFRANNPTAGDEPFTSDGTAAGTVPLEVSPGPGSSIPGGFTWIGDQVVFSAIGPGGDELWHTDLTQAGTARLLDIAPGPVSSNPRQYISVGNGAIFSADDGVSGTEPWRTDGTATGTTRIADVSPGPGNGAAVFFPTRFRDHVLFAGVEAVAGVELWRVPVAGSGADLVANIHLGGGSEPRELSPLADRVLFTADDGIVGRELWVTDGEPGGDTDLVEDFDSAATDSGVSQLTPLGNHVYFVVDGDGNAEELWRSDGTPGGAEIVRDINPVGDSLINDLTAVGPWLYFSATDGGGGGLDIWRSDGVPGGTTEMVADLNPAGSSACGFPSFTAVGEHVYFCGNDGSSGTELYRTDGTPAGTTRVADINPGGPGSVPSDLVVQDNEVLYFSATDAASGDELWALDTAAPGTDVLEGPGAEEHISEPRPALRLHSRAVDMARFECSDNGGAFASCAGLDGIGRTSRLADGEHTLAVRAVDVRENPDQSPEELRFTVDTKGPKVAVKGKRVIDEGGAVRLKLACKRSELSGPCRGKVVLKQAKGGAKIAKRKFRLKPGKAKRLKLKVKPAKRGLLEAGAVRAQGKARDRLGNKRKFRSKKLRVSAP